MKRGVWYGTAIALCLILAGLVWAEMDDAKDMPSCKYCGMNRQTFAQSRMMIDYGDGVKTAECSLHCASLDLAMNLDKAPKEIWVADYGTRKLIDAEAATWVIVDNKPGVMTKNAKWAFEKKDDALAFQKASGGRVVTFDAALEAAYRDLGDDTKMIREKRKMMKMKMMEKK